MTLDPQARQFLDDFAASGTPMPWDVESPARAREVLAGLQPPPDDTVQVASVRDITADTATGPLPVRIFTPLGQGPFPLVLWFHGGGWVVGSLDESENICRLLCRDAGAVVICPDYRLAPEHRYPTAADDCYAVTRWVIEQAHDFCGDPRRVAVAGDSAGGNLAAVVALMARDRGGPALAAQLLVYPVVGLPTDGRESYASFAEDHFLTRAGMEWFVDQYARDGADCLEPYFAPLQETDLSGLPPGFVMTAQYDPLRDEGEAYARRLVADGTACRVRRYEGQIHAFFIFPDLFDAAHDARADAVAFLLDTFSNQQQN